MNSTLVIAQRELVERRFVFVAAIAFALLSIAIPLIPVIHAASWRDSVVILSTIFAANFSIVVALILGSTMIGRELSERRLSFYFSKPVPAASIWFGKLVAALLLVVLSGAIIALPALVVGVASVESFIATMFPPAALEIMLIMPIAGLLIAHVVGTFIRSRSAWIILDVLAASASGVLLFVLGRQLAAGSAFQLIRLVAIAFGLFAALAIIAAGAWQLASGRADRKRSHRELSRFLWISIGAGMAIAAAYVGWVVSMTPADFSHDRFFVQQNNGSWAVLSGFGSHRADYRASFLYNLDDGRWLRIQDTPPWWAGVMTNDQNVAYWLAPSSGFQELWMARLDAPNPKPVPTKFTLRRWAFFNFSNDGSRLAAVAPDGVLTVYDVASGAALGSARLPGRSWVGFFMRPDLVRLYAEGAERGVPGGEVPTAVFEFDITRRTISRTGTFPGYVFRFSRDRSVAILGSFEAIEVRDARSGALVHSISGHWTSARFLRDGRVVALDRDRPLLRIWSAGGVPSRDLALPRRMEHAIDAGIGRVVVASRNGGCVLIDIDRGTVLRVEPQLSPWPFASGPRLICESPGGIVVWDVATGATRKIAG